jgi:hypothetical protein
MRPRTIVFLVFTAACGQDIGVTKSALCDGQAQPSEATVDQPFDVDEDGFFDGANLDCQAAYAADRLDCDDHDPAVHPGAPEVTCNDVDDDCDATTLDGPDADVDGVSACTDCDDANAAVSPALSEVACNGLDDDCDVATLDGADADLDGFSTCSDCADEDPGVSPGQAEVTCNGIDDDCNSATLDADDVDGDGASACVDCDDGDNTRAPSLSEVCDNGIDDDCDSEVDEGCVLDRTGTWDLDTRVSYTCTFGLVSIDFDTVFVEDTYPTITVTSTGSGSQPGTMTGSFVTATDFDVSRTISGSCDEVYALTGTFTSETTFTGTFTASFVGGRACYDCANQSWTVNGTF